jgi:proto-chlorophyllide reductase subunit
MKFLCVPCDSPMKLQSVGPPDSGSLSVVYACPECGYEMAMLTNAYETQIVQSMGVRIGPASASAAAPPGSQGASARAATSAPSATANPAETSAETGGCPFAGMLQGMDGAQRRDTAEPAPVRWTAAAEARLANVPAFVRPMARAGIEKFAVENGAVEVDEQILDAAREFFGM